MRSSEEYDEWENYGAVGLPAAGRDMPWADADTLASQAAYAQWQDRRREAAQLPEQTRQNLAAHEPVQDTANRVGCAVIGLAVFVSISLFGWAVVNATLYLLRLLRLDL